MNIIQKSSPNFGSRCGWKPDVIVCHITDGAYNGAVSWLCSKESGISSHFVVGRDGQISQLVDIRNEAYCNGTQSGSASGYEYVGRATASLVLQRRVNANLYSISIELEGDNSTHGILTDAQFSALFDLIQYIRQQVKSIYGVDIPCDRTHIIGHCEIAPKEKPECPGKDFPWAKLITALNVLPQITHVDKPVAGATITGDLVIGGWALSSAGMERVDIYADVGTSKQQPLGSVKCTSARSDVAKVYPKYTGAGTSGYSLTVPTGTLSAGEHVLGVAGIGKDGKVCWAQVKVIVK
jgi:N-acetyl-anhydromuramyl-L-alanine amidase AmpD